MLPDCYGLFHDTVFGSGCLVLIARVSELSIGTHVDNGDCDQFCSAISAFFLRNLRGEKIHFLLYQNCIPHPGQYNCNL